MIETFAFRFELYFRNWALRHVLNHRSIDARANNVIVT